MENFYEGIVKNLKEDAEKLNAILTQAMKNNDMQLYISTIKSLRETLELISKYDWRLMYSDYGVEVPNKVTQKPEWVTEIAVWEQNHEGQIRNNKVWKTNIPYGKSNLVTDFVSEMKTNIKEV